MLPHCDIACVAGLAINYIQNSGDLDQRRKTRGRKTLAALRKVARTLRAKIAVGEATEQEIINSRFVEFQIRQAPEAFNTKRHGVSGNHTWLLLMREYIQRCSGTCPGPADLAEIVTAARTVQGYKEPVVLPELVSKNLRSYERRNPAMCRLIRLSLTR